MESRRSEEVLECLKTDMRVSLVLQRPEGAGPTSTREAQIPEAEALWDVLRGE